MSSRELQIQIQRRRRMEVSQVMHMTGGNGKTSYAKNSLLQRKMISMTQPILEASITALCSSSVTTPKLVIADLGCSSGPNTFFAVKELIKLGKELCTRNQQEHEYQIFLNDLPGNDFNAVFRSLPDVQLMSDDQILGADCFFSGVPGSFYSRLFPQNTIHFVHSSNSLHWLSQVPKGVEANKGHIYIVSTTPASVLEAYYKQFKHDFSTFLKCRAQEVVPNGRMVLTFPGRKGDDPATGGLCLLWELLARAINQMVTEGVIEEEKMDGFNLPNYNPSEAEVKEEVLKEGSFFIDSFEFVEVNWSGYDESDYGNGGCSAKDEAFVVAGCVRSITESMIIDHFGEAVVEDVFHRYYLLVADHLSKEKAKIVSLVVSLVRTSI